jgi:hypothetical protein
MDVCRLEAVATKEAVASGCFYTPEWGTSRGNQIHEITVPGNGSSQFVSHKRVAVL